MARTERTALEALRDAARDPAGVARDWKARTGGKVLGYRCLQIPEELASAAGMLPYPLYGTPEPSRLADSYLQACSCELVRNLFDHALEGRLAFLDGLALANTCDALRHMADNWRAYVPTVPVHFLSNPQKLMTEANRDYFLEELRQLRGWVEGLAGRQIEDGALREAIALHNETRRLLHELYELRRKDPPPLAGDEALEVVLGASVLPKDEANRLLREAIDEVAGREPPEADGPRILVTGSLVDHPALIQMIEQEGGVVVVEDLCTTTRYFWSTVDEDGDPMEALYRFVNNRPLCACMHPAEARFEHLLGLVDRFAVDAVVDLNLKYCHPFSYEAGLLAAELERRGLPTTVLEVGHDMSGHGQLRTRIQAFVEMLDA